MAYKSDRLDRVFVIRWLASPDLADITRLREELPRRRLEAGEPFVNLSIVPVGVTGPTQDARAAMSKMNDEWPQNARAVHVVIEGEGFKTAIVRSVISALNFATGKRGFIRIYATVGPALVAIAAELRVSPTELREKLEQRGMLSDAPVQVSASP